jgi:hypothetical protein
VSGLEPVREAQVLDGHIGLWTEEALSSLCARLLAQGASAWLSGPELVVRCPWGNEIKVAQVSARDAAAIREQGGHAGGSVAGRMVGIGNVTLNCAPGALGAIRVLYAEVLGCSVESCTSGAALTVRFSSPGPLQQTLVFRASAGAALNAYDLSASKQFHVAVYLESHAAFLRAFRLALARNLVFVNTRFEGGPKEFASSRSEAEAEESGQFRLKDFLQGEHVLFTLEHEVRSPRHSSNPLRRRHLFAQI